LEKAVSQEAAFFCSRFLWRRFDHKLVDQSPIAAAISSGESPLNEVAASNSDVRLLIPLTVAVFPTGSSAEITGASVICYIHPRYQ
jgi:hypothetical protein